MDNPEVTSDLTIEQKPPHARVSPLLVMFLLSGLVGLAIAVAMILAENGAAAPLTTVTEPLVARPVRGQALDFETQTLDGQSVNLSDFRGRTVFLNFWWTGCAPCVQEMPAFQTFLSQQGENGAVVLAMNQGEEPDDIQDFLDEIGVSSLTVLLDEDRTWGGEYGINYFPTTYIIDANGTMRYLKIGEMTVDEMYEYLDAVTVTEVGQAN